MTEKNKWYSYRISGLTHELFKSYEFESVIPDLEDRPEIWKDECPYLISNIEVAVVEQI